jgi:molybdenum cofactor synthesis domain-containing protein
MRRHPLRFGILTISDRSARGERPDLSGPVLAAQIIERGWEIGRSAVVPDERSQISAIVSEWCDSDELDVVLTTGGTGFSPRDVTPEATAAVIERSAPGLAEVIRAESLKVTPNAMLSRGIAGMRKRTLVVNLPGSPKGAVESLSIISPVLPHAVELLHNDPESEAGHNIQA